MKRKNSGLSMYRVEGTFSYAEFCHTNESDLTLCPSFEDCEGHEALKTISMQEEAESAEVAARLVIEAWAQDYTDACWLFGQPHTTYICSSLEHDLQVSTYWTQESARRDEIRKACYPQTPQA